MSFNKRQFLTLLLLAIACIALALLVTLQGPRISQKVFDPQPANQRLILSFSTPLQEQSIQARITPEIAHDVQVEGRTLYILFSEPLPYNTAYTVSLSVTDTRNRSSEINTSFSTAAESLSYIHRGTNDEPDELRETTLRETAEKVLFSHPTILAHAASNHSRIVAISESENIALIHLSGNKEKTVQLPERMTLRSLEGSATQDIFLFTLTNPEGEQSGWFFNARNQAWSQIVTNVGNSLLGSVVSYAPDGQSIYYFDQNRNLVLDNPSDNKPPTILGVFDVVTRILPNHKALLTGRSNGFDIVRPNGAIERAPEAIQLSFQPKILHTTQDFIFITQGLDATGTQLQQFLKIVDANNTVKTLTQESFNEMLFTQLSMSPNDQFTVMEQAYQPVIYDTVIFNNKPQEVFSVIRDARTGDTVRTLNGFDIVWR